MAQSRPRIEEKSFIIIGNRSAFRTCIDFAITMFFWFYSLLVVTFFVFATFGINNGLTRIFNASFNTTNRDIRDLVFIALLFFLFLYTLLYINRLYNMKKFGSLKRRVYPKPATNSELQSLGLMDIETIEKLQSEDYSIFEVNPIVSLEKEKQR